MIKYSLKVEKLLAKINQIQRQEFCFFCTEDLNKNYFNEIITEALYEKYPSSQYYYYTIEINNLLNDVKTSATIFYYDLETELIDLEFLKDMYPLTKY